MGGVGKTTAASLVVREEAVARSFDRICWVALGQDPSILELQRILLRQLTGGTAISESLMKPAEVLGVLREAARGKRSLVVLDDLWELRHEEALNPLVPQEARRRLLDPRASCGRLLVQGADKGSIAELDVGSIVRARLERSVAGGESEGREKTE